VTIPSEFSTWNIENSIAGVLATQLVAADWLIYWYARDAVEVPGGLLYDRWSDLRLAHLANPAFAAALAASRGILTLRGLMPANPTFLQRLTTDGLSGAPELVNLPTIALEVLPAAQVRPWELGSRLYLRSRHALIVGYARSRDEQVLLADVLQDVFEVSRQIAIVHHVDGSGTPVGDVDIVETRIDTDVVQDATQTEAYSIDVSLRLDYIV
jgi:hypothetical protein